MSRSLFRLSDEDWLAIDPLAKEPGRSAAGGRSSGDLGPLPCAQVRLLLVRLPGGLRTVHDHLQLLPSMVAAGAVAKSAAIDNTCIKAQRSAFGGAVGQRNKKGAPAPGDRLLSRRLGNQGSYPYRRAGAGPMS